MILYILLALLALFLIVILARAVAFKPREETAGEVFEVEVNQERAVESLAMMIRCRTVSSRDRALRDESQFEKFRELLKTRYPLIHKTCTLERIEETGLLYRWSGLKSEEPTVLMAHYDVVPVLEADWEKPPFEGIVEDGVLWGRGTLDTKGTLCGVMEAAEQLIGEGFVPQNDIYLCFAGDEEIAGEGAPAIVSELERRSVKPALVVDEGGAVVENVFPGVSEKCALVGTAEKGMMDLKLAIKAAGGHASAPPPHGPLGKLAQALVNIENKPFPARLSPPVKEMFDTLGRHSSFAMRLVFANLWCFMPVLNAICKKAGGELNAMMRTTFAATMAKGSSASNVLPNEAEIVGNIRIIPGETVESVKDYLKSVVNNEEVSFETLHGMNPSISSDTSSEGWLKLKKAINATWPGALVSPYLMVACSDSRHYCRITDKVMRFSAMELTKEERGYIHGNDERIPVEKIGRTVAFYLRLIKQC
ncbi:MAG: M20 family peptidase [Oscillospiraceae bacterium]|nr:M20 family peptidase [Oscillospiraceae bacterium]